MAIIEKGEKAENKVIPKEILETKTFQSLEDTPEFQEALAKALESKVNAAVEEVQAKAGSSSSGNEIAKFAEMFAMAIATLTDQGTGRQRVAPELLKSRQEARDKMKTLIMEAKKQRDMAQALLQNAKNETEHNMYLSAIAEHTPLYVLANKVYLDEMAIDPLWVGPDHMARKTEIEWPGVPNEAMRPANTCAQAIYSAFIESIGSVQWVKDTPWSKDPLSDPLTITARGVVVKGAPTASQMKYQPKFGEDNFNSSASEGVKIKNRQIAGTIEEIKILGTIAAPAQQRV